METQNSVPWSSFPNDINQAIQSATTRANLPSTPFTLNVSTKTRCVENEYKIQLHATVALHEGVEQVLGMLGVNGWFALPDGGNAAIVGDPDFSWIMGPEQLYPKLVVCVSVAADIFAKSCWCRLSTRHGGRWIW
jgi:hypothetical protein